MADERRPPDAQGGHEIPDEPGIGRGAVIHPPGFFRPSETGQVGGEDPVPRGEGTDAGRPDFRRCSQAMDEHDRRAGLALEQAARAKAVDVDVTLGRHPFTFPLPRFPGPIGQCAILP